MLPVNQKKQTDPNPTTDDSGNSGNQSQSDDLDQPVITDQNSPPGFDPSSPTDHNDPDQNDQILTPPFVTNSPSQNSPHGIISGQQEPDFIPGPSLQKEKELLAKHDEKLIEEIGKELELEKEVKDSGVEIIGEELEIPEPVKKMGVEPAGPPILTQSPPVKKLPLSDDQIKKALHHKVADALLWLAVWCLRQLKIGSREN